MLGKCVTHIYSKGTNRLTHYGIDFGDGKINMFKPSELARLMLSNQVTISNLRVTPSGKIIDDNDRKSKIKRNASIKEDLIYN